jgi:hypothetical protein
MSTTIHQKPETRSDVSDVCHSCCCRRKGLRTTIAERVSNDWQSSLQRSLGVDFTLYAPVVVSAVGFMDADESGLVGALVARVFDRSSGDVVIGPIMASGRLARANDSNPFVFVSLAPSVPATWCLLPGGGWFCRGARSLH